MEVILLDECKDFVLFPVVVTRWPLNADLTAVFCCLSGHRTQVSEEFGEQHFVFFYAVCMSSSRICPRGIHTLPS